MNFWGCNAGNSLRDYGAEFADVDFSGEMLSQYKSSVATLEELYDGLDDKTGTLGVRLSEKIAQYKQNISDAENDIEGAYDKLNEDAIIEIKFEYDIASMMSDIEQKFNELANGWDTVTAAQTLGEQQTVISDYED